MKTKIVLGSLLIVFLFAMLPAVHALEYDTARETREQYVEEQLAELREQLQSMSSQELQAALNGDGEAPTCLLLPLKWLAYILVKGLMMPVKLAMHIFFKLLLMPVKLLSIPFRLLLLPFRMAMGLFVGLPLRIALMPVTLFARLISLPFRAMEFFVTLLNPFDCSYSGCCPG